MDKTEEIVEITNRPSTYLLFQQSSESKRKFLDTMTGEKYPLVVFLHSTHTNHAKQTSNCGGVSTDFLIKCPK